MGKGYNRKAAGVTLSLRTIRQQRFSTLERYWNDAAYRRRMDAEAAHQQAIMNAEWDAGQIANGTRFPADWPEADKQAAIAKIMEKRDDRPH